MISSPISPGRNSISPATSTGLVRGAGGYGKRWGEIERGGEGEREREEKEGKRERDLCFKLPPKTREVSCASFKVYSYLR